MNDVTTHPDVIAEVEEFLTHVWVPARQGPEPEPPPVMAQPAAGMAPTPMTPTIAVAEAGRRANSAPLSSRPSTFPWPTVALFGAMLGIAIALGVVGETSDLPLWCVRVFVTHCVITIGTVFCASMMECSPCTAMTRYDSHQSRAQLTTRAGIFRRLISADNPMDICRMDIAQLQTFADNRHLNFDVAQAFAPLSPDTTYRPVGNMEHIEPATPAEIAWASAHVRPLTSPDPLVGELSPLEDRWVRAARTLGVFTPTLLYQHACGSTRDIKPMIQRMLDAGIIAQVQQAKRFVCPAVYRWNGDGSPPTLDTTLLDPPDAETTEERWRNALRLHAEGSPTARAKVTLLLEGTADGQKAPPKRSESDQ